VYLCGAVVGVSLYTATAFIVFFSYNPHPNFFMGEHSLNYNTNNEPIIFREYGRNVQKMVQAAIQLETRQKRTAAAHAIINLMVQLNPNLKNIEEYKHKLWDQLHAIADFKLDIDAPYPVPENLEQIMPKSADVPYPNPTSNVKRGNYGKNLEALIQQTIGLENERKRAELTRLIVYYMHLVHRTWNKDSQISADTIKHDLKRLSHGQLDIDWAEKWLSERGLLKPMSLAPPPIQQSKGSNAQKQPSSQSGSSPTRKRKRKSRKKKPQPPQ